MSVSPIARRFLRDAHWTAGFRAAPLEQGSAGLLDTADDVQGVCHDLRNRLATINMIAAVLRAGPLPVGAQDRLETLVGEVQAALDMVQMVATHRRHLVRLDLTELAGAAARRAAVLTTCEVACVDDGEPVSVRGDALQLTRLIDNLIDNAVRAAGPHGRVEVSMHAEVTLPQQRSAGRGPRATDRAPRAVLSIADSGPGFGLASPGLASLGLHIVRSILDEHDGDLRLGTSHLGGALAEVALPLYVS